MITYEDFEKVDIRVGKIIEVEDFPEAKKPAYKMKVDFGKDFGIKKSSAQITENYTKEELIGKWIIAVINFSPKKIGPFVSEVLILGLKDTYGSVILLSSDKEPILGNKIF